MYNNSSVTGVKVKIFEDPDFRIQLSTEFHERRE